MKDARVRMVIEFDIDSESLAEKGLTPEAVFNHLTMSDSDVIDGFEIYPSGIDEVSVVSDFFLCNGEIISKEIIP